MLRSFTNALPDSSIAFTPRLRQALTRAGERYDVTRRTCRASCRPPVAAKAERPLLAVDRGYYDGPRGAPADLALNSMVLP